VTFKLCYFNRQYTERKKIVGSGEWKKKKINCGAHIKMAKGCGQVARPCNSDVAVTIID